MLIDAGWCPSGKAERSEDILNYRPDVNIPEIIAYGKQKGVKTLLWLDWLPLSTKMDEAFALYEKWGAFGRQNRLHEPRRSGKSFNSTTGAFARRPKHRLTVDFHGAYREPDCNALIRTC